MPIGLGSIMAGAQGGGLIGSLFPPIGRAWVQGQNMALPNEIIDIGSAIALRFRGLLSEGDYNSLMRAHGFVSKNADRMYQTGMRLLQGLELIALERRGQLGELDIEEEAMKTGISPEVLNNLRDITMVIPSASDIISFAVREVYTPEIAEAFGQFDGLDVVVDRAAADIKAIGMTKETFGKYWAAHWMLPSVGQGFEMMHRAVIPPLSTAEEPLGLDRLMTALDIMPAWRDKLTAISYSPFTRVDVRRMHKLGILTDEDLVRAYMDLGFDLTKAEAMRDFTIEYNFRPPETDQTAEDTERHKQRDLTKADVLNGYRDGLLNPEETDEVLHRLGYSPDEIIFYMSREDFRQDSEQVDTQLRYLHDAYVYRVMDFNEITDRMGALNLPSTRVERLFEVWDIEKLAKARKPTKAELMTFLRKKVIDEPVFVTEMEGLGYPQKYIDWYLQTV